MKNSIRVFVTSIFYLISNICNSQFTFNPLTDCPDITVEETSLRDLGGLLKPERTDLSGGVTAPSNSRLNVLLVFVQFANESAESGEWPIDDSAIYMHDLLAENKDTVSNSNLIQESFGRETLTVQAA
ncbi:MAG: hypothetical protein JNJ56_13495 [Ignavibacteria bacterium]|nr:hypothetical protein [Ignavibacteria bacterium]